MTSAWKPKLIERDGRGNLVLVGYDGTKLRIERRDIAELRAELAEEEQRYASIDPTNGTIFAEELTPTVPVEPLLQFFKLNEMPGNGILLGQKIADLATAIVLTVSRNPERTTALRKLLETWDCVRHGLVYVHG